MVTWSKRGESGGGGSCIVSYIDRCIAVSTPTSDEDGTAMEGTSYYFCFRRCWESGTELKIKQEHQSRSHERDGWKCSTHFDICFGVSLDYYMKIYEDEIGCPTKRGASRGLVSPVLF